MLATKIWLKITCAASGWKIFKIRCSILLAVFFSPFFVLRLSFVEIKIPKIKATWNAEPTRGRKLPRESFGHAANFDQEGKQNKTKQKNPLLYVTEVLLFFFFFSSHLCVPVCILGLIRII